MILREDSRYEGSLVGLQIRIRGIVSDKDPDAHNPS